MRALAWIVCLWPGLAALWLRGRWTGLAVATAFTALLNVTLVTTIGGSVWTSNPGVTALLWGLVLGFWVVGCWMARRADFKTIANDRTIDPKVELLFAQAQSEYLKGHWIETEILLVMLLGQQPEDIEARLLLGTVQRRMRRLTASQKTLTELSSCVAAVRWSSEIKTELARLAACQNVSCPEKPADHSVSGDSPLARAA